MRVGLKVKDNKTYGDIRSPVLIIREELLLREGLASLTLQAHYPKLKPPVCGAGVKATLPSHGADQLDGKDPKEAKEMSSFFNWLLLGVAVGGSVSLTFFVWVQDNKGFDYGFGLSLIAMFLGAIIFIFGLPTYRIYAVKGSSAITEILQRLFASLTVCKYLLRIANAALNDELFFAIAGHNMRIVEIDVVYTKPFTTSAILIAPGQTKNVLVFANSAPGCYFMAVRPFQDLPLLSLLDFLKHSERF
ncbi:NRT1/ PTR family 4.5-like protein [Tanacetum coccineum]